MMNFVADAVKPARVIRGGVFFTGNEILRMEELTIGSGADFVDDRRFQVHVQRSGHEFAVT